MRKGFTLVECMLASSILCLMTLVLFETVIISSRIAKENAQLLAAEAVAWDAVWKRFNEGYDSLMVNETTGWRDLSAEAAPELSIFDTPAKLKVDVYSVAETGWPRDMKEVVADVEWGPQGRRRKLSDGKAYSSESGHIRLRRGNLGRAP